MFLNACPCATGHHAVNLEGSAEAMNMPHMMVHPLFAFLSTFSASWQVVKGNGSEPNATHLTRSLWNSGAVAVILYTVVLVFGRVVN